MTVKITQIYRRDTDKTTVRVEGKLYLADAEILEQSVSRLQKEGGAPEVEIDLSGVSFLNHESAAILRRLRRCGAILTDINFFIEKVIEQSESTSSGEEINL